MSNVVKGLNYYKLTENRRMLLLSRVRGVYADVCNELEQADPDDNAWCLALSNLADDIAGFISELRLRWEGAL